MNTTTPKYPDVTVQLSGEDGNAMMIVGTVRKALRQAGVERAELEQFVDEALAGDYDDVLRTARRWVDVRADALNAEDVAHLTEILDGSERLALAVLAAGYSRMTA